MELWIKLLLGLKGLIQDPTVYRRPSWKSKKILPWRGKILRQPMRPMLSQEIQLEEVMNHEHSEL